MKEVVIVFMWFRCIYSYGSNISQHRPYNLLHLWHNTLNSLTDTSILCAKASGLSYPSSCVNFFSRLNFESSKNEDLRQRDECFLSLFFNFRKPHFLYQNFKEAFWRYFWKLKLKKKNHLKYENKLKIYNWRHQYSNALQRMFDGLWKFEHLICDVWTS